MAQTPTSSSTGYASASDLLERHDTRVIQQLASDTNVMIPSGSLAANTRVIAALMGASGQIESAIMAGERYTPEDLAALTGASLASLKDLVCLLAMVRLFRGRSDMHTPTMTPYKEALEELDKLRNGKWVFGFTESREAGKMQSVVEEAADVMDRNGLVIRTERYFGVRVNRLKNPGDSL